MHSDCLLACGERTASPGDRADTIHYTQASWRRSPGWKGPANVISDICSPETKPTQPQSKAEVFWLLCTSPSHPVPQDQAAEPEPKVTSGSWTSPVLLTLGSPWARDGHGDEGGWRCEGAGWVGRSCQRVGASCHASQDTPVLEDGGAAGIMGQAGLSHPQQWLCRIGPVTGVFPGCIPRDPFWEGFPGFFWWGWHHAVDSWFFF